MNKRRKSNPFREWLSDNLRYFALILLLAAIVVGAIFVVKAIRGRGETDSRTAQTSSVTESASSSSETAASSASSAEQATPTPTPTETPAPNSTDDPAKTPAELHTLTEADAAVTEPVQSYFDGLLASPENELIADYSQISVFTSPGQKEGEQVAFASYLYKYRNFEEQLPGLSYFYLVPDGAGGFTDVTDNLTADQQSFLEDVKAGADVQALMKNLLAQEEEVLASDPELKAFVDSLDG